MIDLAFWREAGVSDADEAEVRYRDIIEGRDPARIAGLDERLQRLIRTLKAALSGLERVPLASDAYGEIHSRLGVVVRIGDGMPETTYGIVMGLPAPTRLTMYDRESRLVVGADDSIDIELHDE